MHSGDMTELGGVNLTDAEREALLEVMQRAKDFDDKTQKMNSRLEGQLHKWTNALKGWQPRWLSVDQQQGVLHYYTSEDRKKSPPRGSLHLWGAVVAPSDEDSQTFTVNGANGEVYRLRGADAKERQYWVSRLRNEIERCSSAHAVYASKPQVHVTSGVPTTSHTHSSATPALPLSPIITTSGADRSDTLSPTSPHHTTPTRKHSRSKRGLAVFTSRTSIKKRHKKRRAGPSGEDQEDLGSGLPGGEAMLELLTRLQKFQSSLNAQLESCSGTGIGPLDQNVLLLKATAQAAVHSVKDCLALIKLQQASSAVKPLTGEMSSAVVAGDDSEVDRRLVEGGGSKSSRPLSATEHDTPSPVVSSV